MTRTLNAEVNKVVRRPEVVAAFAEQGMEPAPGSPEAFAALVKSDYEGWRTIIGELGFKRE